MKKIGLILCLLMLMVSAVFAIYVEVGTGTTSSYYVPSYGWYNYSWSRTIYLQAELINEMEINTISYNVSNNPSNYSLTNQSYYMRHTTASSIQSTNYVNPATDNSFQLVYSGTATYNGSGWHDINLDTAFEYNGTSNLEIVVLNNNGSYANGYPAFYTTGTTENRSLYKYSDNSFPTTSGNLYAYYPNTRFHFTAEGEPSMATLTAPVNGSFNVASPVELTWTNGADTDWVKVYLSDNADDVSTMNPRALVANNYTQQSYTANDLNVLTNYYWRIISGNDTQYLASSAVWNFTTASADGAILIGNGTLTNQGLPFEPWYRHSYSQSIYLAGEIGLSSQQLEKISWHYNGNSAWGPDDFKVYMGMTDATSFSNNTSWISASEMVEVYDGTITVPNSDGYIEIELDTPFDYSNARNLVVGVFHTADSYHANSDEFYCTPTDVTRSLLYYHDSIIPNHQNPPSANYMRSSYPNVVLQFIEVSDVVELTVNPTNVAYEMVLLGSNSPEKTLTMKSMGLQDVVINVAPTIVGFDSNQFSITRDNNSYPLVLSFGQRATIGVTFTPNYPGAYNGELSINNNSPTQPIFRVNLRGVCETPPPDNPGNVQFAMSNNNASITWDAVTEDINHNPITPSVYAVYYNQFDGVTDNLFYFLTYTTGLSYNHIGVGRFSEFMFYRVKAYVDIDIRVLNDIDRLVKQKDKVSMEEIERLINDK